MKHINASSLLRVLSAPQFSGVYAPKRKGLPIPSLAINAFVRPVRQSFVTNPRMMPQTRCMVLMLMGWAGHEQALETTIGIIAKKIGRSARQVHRYLQDAIEEGYLFYSRTKDRIGYYTGIKIHLNFSALKPKKTRKKRPVCQETRDMTEESDTNNKDIYKRKNIGQEQDFQDKIDAILKRNNLEPE